MFNTVNGKTKIERTGKRNMMKTREEKRTNERTHTTNTKIENEFQVYAVTIKQFVGFS